MKRTISFLVAIFSFTYVFGQSGGLDDAVEIDIKPVRSALIHATGWINQGGGNWLSGDNKIPYILTEKSAAQAAQETMSRREERRIRKRLKASREEKMLGKDNFTRLELRDVLIDGQSFQVLIIKKTVGEYEFPIIKENFNSYEKIDYYVFRSERLQEVLPSSLTFNEPYIADLQVFTSGEIPYYKSKNVPVIISNKIKKSLYKRSLNSYSATNMLIACYPVVEEGERLMRFNLFRSYNKAYMTRSYYEQHNLQEIFTTQYYQTPFSQFKEFIGTPSVVFRYSDEQPTTFKEFCKLGLNQYQYGDYYNAVANLNKALRLRPDYSSYVLYAHRGNAKFKMGDLFGAIDDYNRAIDYEPASAEDKLEWVQCYYNRGIVKFHLNDVNEACADWTHAFELGLEKAGEKIEQYCQ
jgi:hypothetical protein